MNRTIFLTTGAAFIFALLNPAAADDAYSGNAKVRTLLHTSKNIVDQTIGYPRSAPAVVTIEEIVFPPGGETGWHKHPVPLFGYVISGTLTIHFEGGKTKVIHAGEALAESVDMIHNGRNEGTEPVKMVVFIDGEKDVPFTVKVHADKDGKPLP